MSTQETRQSTWSIEPISLTDVPPQAVSYFMHTSVELEREGSYLAHPQEGFKQYLLATQGDGINTFAAEDTKTYIPNLATERLIYLSDYDPNGEEIGFGDIRLGGRDHSTYFRDKPYVGYTRTHPALQRQGYGLRRLKAMNALSEHVFGLKLHSDTLLTGEAHRLWGRLVEQEVAVSYLEGPHTRYCFA